MIDYIFCCDCGSETQIDHPKIGTVFHCNICERTYARILRPAGSPGPSIEWIELEAKSVKFYRLLEIRDDSEM